MDQPGAVVEKLMTVAQIEKKYKSEWVLLSDPELDKNNQIVRGKVVYHSKDRDKVYQKAGELKPKFFATLYTGKLRKDMAIIL
jgi:hypothetical protein